MSLLIGSLQLGFLYGIMALGIYITFRILNIPDLTTEGSFTLGLAVSGMMTISGHPWLGILMAALAGAAAGAVTGLLQTKLGIHAVLAGILTMSGLYTVNLMILGSRSNLSLIGSDTLFKQIQDLFSVDKDAAYLIIAVLAAVLFAAGLIAFFRTHLGLCIRATGDNEDMVSASSIDVHAMKIIALAVSNACVAVSGGLIAQYQGFADISSGTGMLVVGLASVIIGEVFTGKRSLAVGLCSSVLGSIVYRFIIALAMKSPIFPAYALKLVSAVIVAAALAIPVIRYQYSMRKKKKEAGTHA
ncbi:MAG TPA: ABC transporter permease [Candidatus Fimimorpha excrementavium]|nr:ABC transporter permease [Candidatus Fimimorpha excrementavium]